MRDWKKKHPHTLVLSDETGYSRNYKKSLYPGYRKSRKLYFKVNYKAPKQFHPNEHVMGLEVEGKFKAYLFKELSRKGENTFADAFAGISFKVHWDEQELNAYITDVNDKLLVTMTGFWFVWFAFHPETEVYEAPE